MRRRMHAAAALLAGTALAVTACSSSGAKPADPFATGGAASGTALARAMDEVSGSGPASSYFEFGDMAGLRRLGVIEPATLRPQTAAAVDPRWNGALYGTGPIGSAVNFLPDLIDLNVFGVDTAVAIGEPPDVAVRLDGPLDAKTISTKLAGVGAKPRQIGATPGLSFGPDNSINSQSPFMAQLQLQNQLDQIVVSDHGFAASANAPTLLRALGQGQSLLHTGSDARLAACLGDAVAAVVMTEGTDAHVTGYGLALQRPAARTDPLHEVLCVSPRPGQQSAAYVAMQQRFSLSAVEPYHQVPISRLTSKTEVTEVGDLVRVIVTIPASEPPWLLAQSVQLNEVRYWDGACDAAAAAQSRC